MPISYGPSRNPRAISSIAWRKSPILDLNAGLAIQSLRSAGSATASIFEAPTKPSEFVRSNAVPSGPSLSGALVSSSRTLFKVSRESWWQSESGDDASFSRNFY